MVADLVPVMALAELGLLRALGGPPGLQSRAGRGSGVRNCSRRADDSEQAEALLGLAARPGVVRDEGLHVGGGYEQLLVTQFQRPDLGMLEQADAGGLVPDVLPRPQRAETIAAQR